LLQKEWEQLASKVKGQVKVAYWDTEQAGTRPRLLGEISGTPTIRLYKPKKKQPKLGGHADKVVVDFRQERNVKSLQQFLEDQMPNYVERVVFSDDYVDKVQPKAQKYGLPQAILFTSKPKTTALLKYLSTEFRRRLLLVQVPPTKKTKTLMEEFGIIAAAADADALPALIIVHPDGTRTRYDEKDFTRRKLERFLQEHALTDPVYKPVVVEEEEEAPPTPTPKEEEDQEEPTSKEDEKVHVEL
jgi:hypothetical protein